MLILSFASGGKMKVRRKHADDGVNHIVEGERLTERGAFAAEVAPEKSVGQNGDMSLRRIGRGGVEPRAERRSRTEKREDIGRSARAFDPFRLGAAGQVEVRVF